MIANPIRRQSRRRAILDALRPADRDPAAGRAVRAPRAAADLFRAGLGHREISGADRLARKTRPRDRAAWLPARALERDRRGRRAVLVRPRARRLQEASRQRAAWLAGAELRLLEIPAARAARRRH